MLWLLFFWRILTPNLADRLTFQQGDFTQQFLAYRQMAYRQIVAGHFPSFEDCLYSGYTFQADPQSQVLYPPVMGMLLLGRALGWPEYPLRALEWEVMLHILLAALGMFAFLRDGKRIHIWAAVFGALAYAFGGFMTGYAMLQTGILETAAWTPLILFLLRRVLTPLPSGERSRVNPSPQWGEVAHSAGERRGLRRYCGSSPVRRMRLYRRASAKLVVHHLYRRSGIPVLASASATALAGCHRARRHRRTDCDWPVRRPTHPAGVVCPSFDPRIDWLCRSWQRIPTF